jgi:dTMP kinase
VARSLPLVFEPNDDGHRLRRELFALAPAQVAWSLVGQDGSAAWALRDSLRAQVPDAVVASLGGVGTGKSWKWREAWLEEIGGTPALTDYRRAHALASSVLGLEDKRAWLLRDLTVEADPVGSMASIEGLTSDQAWRWRHRFKAAAPKVVMKTVTGLGDVDSWALRAELAKACKEVFDSLYGLGDDGAWILREQHADRWPSTVVKSLGPLAHEPRGRQLVAALLPRHRSLSLLKHAAWIALDASRSMEKATG